MKQVEAGDSVQDPEEPRAALEGNDPAPNTHSFIVLYSPGLIRENPVTPVVPEFGSICSPGREALTMLEKNKVKQGPKTKARKVGAITDIALQSTAMAPPFPTAP